MIKKRIITVIGIVICTCCCIIGIILYKNYKTADTRIDAELSTINNSKYLEATTSETIYDDNNLPSMNNNNSTDDKNVTELYAHVYELGEQVLDLEQEQRTQEYIFGYDAEHYKEAEEALTTIRMSLQELFLDKTVTYISWYDWDANEITPKWFFYIDSNYSDSQIPVCWICKDDSNTTVLATMIAKYDIASNIFWDTRMYTTYEGTQYIPYENADDDGNEVEIDSISSQQFISGVKSIADALEEYTEPFVVEPDEIPYKYDYDEEETGR